MLKCNPGILDTFPFMEETFKEINNYHLMMDVLHYLKDKIVPAISENTEEIEQLRKYVDDYLTGFDELKEQVRNLSTLVNDIDSQVIENTNDILALTNELHESVQDLRNEFETNLNGAFNILKEYIDYYVEDLNNKINNIQIGAINVYNPTNGLLQPLQTVINSLYEVGNKDGLTASEFDALELTATEFDAYDITAYEFDSAGKTILV